MLGEFFGLLAALFFGVGEIFVRKGLASGGTPFSSVYLMALVNVIILCPLALLFTDPEQIGITGLGFLIMAGFVGSTLARLMRSIAISKLGIAGSAPLIASYPLFAAAFATLTRSEEFTPILATGTILIIIGVSLLFEGEWKISKLGVVLALTAAIFFGAAENFRKVGVSEIGSPSFAAAVVGLVAFVTYAIYARASKTSVRLQERTSYFFIGGGIASSSALLTAFTALTLVDVVVVAPLLNTTVLFALLLARIFLPSHEKITPKVVICALIIMFGAILIVTR